MFFWFIATAVITIGFVFRDPTFDNRLLIVGSVLPIGDALFGGARAADALDDATGPRADIGAAVALDFRHVRQAADREAVKLAAQRPRDGAADGRFANARRPNQAQDFAFHGALELGHSDEFLGGDRQQQRDTREQTPVVVRTGATRTKMRILTSSRP